MYEKYLFLLNEIYFGQTKEIKLLEKIFKIYVDFCKYNIKYDLNDYELTNMKINNDEIKQKFNTLVKNKIIGHYRDLKDNKFHPLNKNINNSNQISSNKYLQNILSLLEDYIELIFGFIRVRFEFYKNFGETGMMNYDFSNFFGPKTKMKIMIDEINYNKKLKNKKNSVLLTRMPIPEPIDIFLIDYVGRQMSIDDARKSIIITDNGMYFNPNKLAISTIIKLPNLEIVTKFNMTEKDILAILLHEIGHNFEFFFLPTNCLVHYYYTDPEISSEDPISKIYKRSGEIFADKFVSLYGYSKEYIEMAKKYFDRPTTFSLGSLKNIKNDPKAYFENLKNTRIANIHSKKDTHPQTYTRLSSLLDHLKTELKNPNISDKQRKKINTEIKRTEMALKDYKYNPNVNIRYKKDEIPLTSEEMKEAEKHLKKATLNIELMKLSLGQEDREYQKKSKVDSRLLTSRMNILYNKKDDPYIDILQGTFYKDKRFDMDLSEYEKKELYNAINDVYQIICNKNYKNNNFEKKFMECIKCYYKRQIHWAESLGYYDLEGMFLELYDHKYHKLINYFHTYFPSFPIDFKKFDFSLEKNKKKLSSILDNLFYYESPSKDWEYVEKMHNRPINRKNDKL